MHKDTHLTARLTALFLATKTSNHPIALDFYTSRIPKTAPADVLDLEFLVAQSLGFDFAVWHAHRALWGLWLDMQVSSLKLSQHCSDSPRQSLPDVSLDDLKAAYESALGHVRSSRLTDAEFIYSPSQIALACMSLASPPLADAWVRSKYGASPPSASGLSGDSIIEVVNALKTIISLEGSSPDVEAVREVDRRLKLCKNPEKIPGTNAYNKRLEEKQRKADEKRRRKAEVVRKAMEDDDDVFGSNLRTVQQLDDDDDDD